MKIRQVHTAHRGPVTGLLSTQNQLFTCSSDGTSAIYDIQFDTSQNKLYTTYKQRLFGHTQRGISSISYQDQTLLMGADDCTVLINTATNTLIQKYHQENTTAVAQTADCIFAASSDASLKMFERASATQLCVFRGHESSVLAVATHGDMIVTGGQDGKLVFYNVQGMTLHTMRFAGPISDLRLSPNGGFLAILELQHSISIVKLDAQQLQKSSLVRKFPITENKYLHQISFYNRQILFGGEGRMLLLDIKSGNAEQLMIDNEEVLSVTANMELGAAYAGCRSGRMYVIQLPK